MLALLIRAHYSRLIDLGQMCVSDGVWWKKARFAIEHVQAELTEQLAKLDLDINAAALSRSDIQFWRQWEATTLARNRLENSLKPWAEAKPVCVSDILNAMSDTYTNVFGDPNDPQFEKEVDKLISSWERGHADDE